MEFTLNRETAGKFLLAIGMILTVYTSLFSDLGLDTHVLMAVEDGSLPWGHTRTQDPLASDLDYAPAYYDRADTIYGILESEIQIKLTSFACMIGLVLLCGFLSAPKEEGAVFNFRVAGIISIYPAFIFSTGRGYMEVPIAIIFLLTHLEYHRTKSHKETNVLRRIVIAGIGISAIAWLKGLTVLIGVLWAIFLFMIDSFEKNLNKSSVYFYQILIGLGLVSILAVLTYSHGGLVKPVLYLFAAFIDIFLFIVFGLCLTHLIFMKQISAREFMHRNFQVSVIIISVILVCAYWIADLWLTEATLWTTSSMNIFIIMGNNGRYATILAPFLLLVFDNIDTTEFRENGLLDNKIITFNLVLIVLIGCFAGIHGQKMWTDDAAESLSANIEDGGEFVLIHENELAMHWLYTMYSELEQQGDDVTGHWRSPESNFISELENQEEFPKRSSLENVSFVVIQPGVDLDLPSNWELIDSDIPPRVFGNGEWRIFRI